LKNGKDSDLAVDGLFVAIGYEPNTRIFEGQLRLEKNGYIWVNHETETSVPGVFATGDVRLDSMKRVASAVGEGAMSIYFVHRYLATT